MTRSRRRKLAREHALQCRANLRGSIPVAATLLAAAPGVYAADAPGEVPEVGALQEVVVTAEKRVENLQDVPISVQVFNTQRLEQLGIVNLDDYVKFSPSVSYSRGTGGGDNGEPGNSHVYIRGVVSGGEVHSGSQPSVATYLDEEPVTTIDGNVDVHLYDIQRIEVLEGPQGTLFGASSEAGTIRIITNKPDTSKFAAGYDVQGNQVQHGSTGWEAQGFVNIPVSSFAAVRLVGWDEHDAGYISNVAGTNQSACIVNGVRTFPTWSGQPIVYYNPNYPTPYPCPPVGVVGAGAISNAAFRKSDYNPVDTKGGRGALKLELGESWTVTPTFMAQDLSTEGFFAYDPAVGDLQIVHFGPEDTDDSWYQGALTVEGKFSDFDLVYAGAYFKRTGHSLGEYSDYSVFYDRAYGSGVNWVGNSGKPIMPQEFVISVNYYEKWSHELRLTTPANRPVKATLGLFIQRQLHNIWDLYSMPGYGYTSVFTPPGSPNGFATSLSIPGFPDAIWLTDEQRVDRDKAAFAQLTWDISSQWALTGGLRWYKYDNSLLGFWGYSANYSSTTGQAACFAPASTKYAPCTDLDSDVSRSGTVPRVNLTYKITPEQMVYATYSKGFRPGGVNRVSAAPPYAADYLTNYELGWKTQWFNRRLRWNGALFWEDWKNFQFSFLVPPSITAIANGGNARIKGLENELEWAAGEHLLITSNFTFLNPVLLQNYCGGFAGMTNCPSQMTGNAFLPGGEWIGPLAPAGTNLPTAPKFKGDIVARYTLGAVRDWAPFAQASWVYQTQTAPELRADETRVIGMQPAYGLVDLAAGAEHNGLRVQLTVTNVTDKRAQLSRLVETNTIADNQVYIIPAQPRTFAINVAQRF